MNNHRRNAVTAVLLASLACLAVLGAGASSTQAAGVVISPLPGTLTAMPQTQISFLGASASSLSGIAVIGSSSGRHSGALRSYSAALGTSFLPTKPFAAGEHVTVHARWRPSAKGPVKRLTSSFTVAQPGPFTAGEFPATPGTAAEIQSFQSQPALHPAVITVHQAAAGTAPGLLFATPFLGPGQWGPMIFDNAGNLVWFQPLPAGEDAADFRTQTYHGKPVLTWWQGKTTILGYGVGEDLIADSSYRVIRRVKAGNGLAADEHEFLLAPDGSAFVLAFNPVVTSLASAGGPASGVALDGVIQRVDPRTGLVMWQWNSIGRVDVSESYSKPPTSSSGTYDYFHINSLTSDSHGNLLISARNTWALYDINHGSGAIVWRLGGKRSSFTLGAGVQFAYQHNALWLPNGDISLFDDEGAPPVKPPSRGEVIKLNLHTKTATLASQLVRSSGPLITTSQGDMQSLPGGGWLVGWGGLPNFTEFNSRGEIVYDAQLPRGENSYRVYREVWSGQPSEPPTVAAHRSGAASAVYASWNGATNVASWQLLTGSSPAHMTAVSLTPRSGFETTIPAPPAPLYQVRALNASGTVLGTSATVAPSG
jgi:Arylsulfotransferase (ASST)